MYSNLVIVVLVYCFAQFGKTNFVVVIKQDGLH